MKTKKQNDIVNWDYHLDLKYGKRGTSSREKYAEEFEAFKIGVLKVAMYSVTSLNR